jgi:hypothetical protein
MSKYCAKTEEETSFVCCTATSPTLLSTTRHSYNTSIPHHVAEYKPAPTVPCLVPFGGAGPSRPRGGGGAPRPANISREDLSDSRPYVDGDERGDH